MSRLGKKPITIPSGIELEIEGNTVKCKGSKGELSFNFDPRLKVVKEDDKVFVQAAKDGKKINEVWGTTKIMIDNMILGVKDGFEKQLEIIGVGYRAQVKGKNLVLNLGFSRPLEMQAPEGIEFKVQKNIISVLGIDKQLVGKIAAEIRDLKKPEPYKGKGIRYIKEYVRKKAGKKAVSSAGAA